MSDWTEVEAHEGERVRWRVVPGEFARESSRYELEYWHDSRREWREVVSVNARDWFAIGVEAGKAVARKEKQTELAL